MRKPLGCVALKLPDAFAIGCWVLDAPEFSTFNKRRIVDNAAGAEALRRVSERTPQILVRGGESFVINFESFLKWQSDYELLDGPSYTIADASGRERADGVDLVLTFYPERRTGFGGTSNVEDWSS